MTNDHDLHCHHHNHHDDHLPLSSFVKVSMAALTTLSAGVCLLPTRFQISIEGEKTVSVWMKKNQVFKSKLREKNFFRFHWKRTKFSNIKWKRKHSFQFKIWISNERTRFSDWTWKNTITFFSPSRVLAYIQIGTFIAVLMTISWIFSTFFFQVWLGKWKFSWRKHWKVKVVIKEKIPLFSICSLSWGLGVQPIPAAFNWAGTIQFRIDHILISILGIILSLSSWPYGCHDHHRHLDRSLCCSIEDDDEEEEKGPMRATAYTVSDTVLSQVIFDDRDDCNINVIIKIRLTIIVTIIIRFLETPWAVPLPHPFPRLLRWLPYLCQGLS